MRQLFPDVDLISEDWFGAGKASSPFGEPRSPPFPPRTSMRILSLNHNVVRRGGTFFRAYHAARHLVRRGHTVTLLTISAERRWGFRREVSEGVEIIETPDALWGVGRSGWDLW